MLIYEMIEYRLNDDDDLKLSSGGHPKDVRSGYDGVLLLNVIKTPFLAPTVLRYVREIKRTSCTACESVDHIYGYYLHAIYSNSMNK